MFSNFDEILAALKGLPGAMGGAMPQVGQNGQVPITPATPITEATPATAATPVTPVDATQTGSVPLETGPLSGIGGMLGLNDSKGGPTAFGGLLNFKDDDSKQAALRGMLSGFAGLMAAGGPSDKPHSFGQDLAQGIASGVGGYDAYKDGLSDRAYKDAATKKIGIDNAAELQKAQLAEQAAAARQRLFGGVGFNGGSNTGATAGSVPASGSASTPVGGDLAGQINRQRATYQAQYNGLMALGDTTAANPIFAQMNNLDNEAAKHGLVWNGQTYTAAPGFNEGAQTLKQAEATGTSLGNRNAWTDDQKELYQVNTERAAKGLPALGMEEYSTSQKRASATNITVNDGNKYGTIPSGYRLVEGPNGAYMEAIPGSPDEIKAAQAAAAKDKKADHAQVSSDAVETAFNNVLRVDSNSTLPTTGLIGGLLSDIGGTGANDMRAALETLKANASLSTMQKMRDESPTGAGMGNPTGAEQAMIQASLASLEQSQTREEFIRNLNNFRNLWMDLVHGQGNGPERHPVTYGLHAMTEAEKAAAEGNVGSSGLTGSTNNAATGPVQIMGVDDFNKLASGTVYIDPQGVTRTKR